MRPGLVLVVAAAVVLLAGAMRAGAEDDGGGGRLSEGLDRVVSGPLAVPDTIAQQTQAHGPAAGVPVGLAVGVGTMVWRECTGVYGIVRSLGDASPVTQPDQFDRLQRAASTQRLRIGR